MDANAHNRSDQARDGTDAPPAREAAQDSRNFLRCSSCRHAEEVDNSAGTFRCAKHAMRCDAEEDAIPDACAEFEPAAPQGPGA
jgi:hypothetical protein